MEAMGSGARAAQPRSIVSRIGLSPKMVVLAAVCLCLGAVLALTLNRDGSSTRKPMAASRVLEPTRPPLSSAEEEYIRSLWPIHGDVERSTAVMSLGEIFYLTHDPDMTTEKFKKRVDAALSRYLQAEEKLRTLQPPAALQKKHDEYLAAVLLLAQSARERLKLFDDGQIDHLHAAYPPLQQATDTIRVIGSDFWPGEFVPH